MNSGFDVNCVNHRCFDGNGVDDPTHAAFPAFLLPTSMDGYDEGVDLDPEVADHIVVKRGA